MYKNKCFFLLLCLLFFSGCSEENITYKTSESFVRQKVEDAFYSVEWQSFLDQNKEDYLKSTDELQIISSFPQENGENFNVFPQVLNAVVSKKNVYPFYKDFDFLDVSNAPNKLILFLDEFFASAVLPEQKNREVKKEFLDNSFVFLKSLLQENFADLPTVNNYLYGVPQKIDSSWEVPVRFLCNGSFVDVAVYVFDDNQTYVIEQIYFGKQIYE